MTETDWMMQEIITVHLAGHMRGVKEKSIHTYEKEEKSFFLLRRCCYI